MLKILKAGGLGAMALMALMTGGAGKAHASDYCREYTRTVSVGGRLQDAYGTACLQPNGDWMIVGEGLSNDIPANASAVDYVVHDTRRDVIPNRVVYYSQPQIRVYRTQPLAPTFIWYHNGFYRNGHYTAFHRDNRGNNGWRGHNDWHSGRDRHDNHRGRGHR